MGTKGIGIAYRFFVLLYKFVVYGCDNIVLQVFGYYVAACGCFYYKHLVWVTTKSIYNENATALEEKKSVLSEYKNTVILKSSAKQKNSFTTSRCLRGCMRCSGYVITRRLELYVSVLACCSNACALSPMYK